MEHLAGFEGLYEWGARSSFSEDRRCSSERTGVERKERAEVKREKGSPLHQR